MFHSYINNVKTFRPALLFAQLPQGVHEEALTELLEFLNGELQSRTSTPHSQDSLARYWIRQNLGRMFPTHPKYLIFEIHAFGDAIVAVPKQQPLKDAIEMLLPLGLDNGH